MFPQSMIARQWLDALDARWPRAFGRLRRRAGPFGLAVLLELLLLLVLLSLGVGHGNDQPLGPVVTTFDAAEDKAPEPDKPQPKAAAAASAAQTAPTTPPPPSALPSPPPIALPRTPTAPPVPPPAPPAPPVDTPPAPAQPKIRAVVRSDMAGAAGPADTGAREGDSQRIAGSGPNGEPLYAAKWYREPTDDEFRGYFSRVSGSAWALINCQTEPEFRVDKCVLVDEWPERSGIGSGVLAAAWQFRVRPPRVGGRVLVGEWVRIRIDYIERRQ